LLNAILGSDFRRARFGCSGDAFSSRIGLNRCRSTVIVSVGTRGFIIGSHRTQSDLKFTRRIKRFRTKGRGRLLGVEMGGNRPKPDVCNFQEAYKDVRRGSEGTPTQSVYPMAFRARHMVQIDIMKGAATGEPNFERHSKK